MQKISKDDFVKETFREGETVTIQARGLQNLLIASDAKDREINYLKKQINQLKDELETKKQKCARLELELIRKEPVYTLDLSA